MKNDRTEHRSAARRSSTGGDSPTIAAPLSAHAEWEPSADRPDPVDLLVEQNVPREPDLVPLRHGRMMASPFTFYRGAARIMATDLASTQTAGLDVQLCGDAHLSNFGGFGSPERQLVFDLNDFDETLPGPFEYDVKRMATSFTIAARHNLFSPSVAEAVTRESVNAYRAAMAAFAEMVTLDVWYAHLSDQDFQRTLLDARLATIPAGKSGKKKPAKGKDTKRSAAANPAKDEIDRAIKVTNKAIKKARGRDSLQALTQYTELVGGNRRIVSSPPLVVPQRELSGAWGLSAEAIRQVVRDQFEAYKATLSADRRQLLDRFTIVDTARKVVGVGSVGTRAFMVLLQGRDAGDPLFLQVKEANRSVLEDHLPKSQYENRGQRVVEGQRLTQSVSDIFLGWTKGIEDDRFYYWRQLRDMKVSAQVDRMTPFGMSVYARMCGWTLAHAHARSGDPAAIADYLGDDDAFDDAVVAFAEHYADQNDRDYDAFVRAVASGRIEAQRGV
ncbi:DUF2252 domain-containing protein [Mycetocola sp. 2940]|uniref:DUF2252 domain-containing protein n=1 Tax=Mycetocola sp. 2940 TaxID=3156452 RepID=UPI0033923186